MLEHAKDEAATAARHFLDPDSYVSNDGHDYLAGRDRSKVRQVVLQRDKYRCVQCGKYVGFRGEMDHRKGGDTGRCDCLTCNRHGDGRGNLQTLCMQCHRGPNGKHP